MMWIQIGIAFGTAILWLAWKKQWIRIELWANTKLRRRMILLFLIGSLTGLLLTLLQGDEKRLTEEERRIQKEENVVVKEYDVIVDGRRETLEIQIPMLSSEDGEQDSGEKQKPKEKTMQEKVKETVEEWNKDKQEEKYYELPEKMEDMEILWMYPKQNDGLIVTLLFAVLGVGIYFLEKQQEQNKKEERKEALLRDYPGMITKMALLIQAGMTVRMSIKRMAEDYKKVRREGAVRAGYEELLITCQEIESGIAETSAYENLGVRAGEIRYKTLSTLLVQSLRRGSGSLEAQLEREATDAFEERKRMARILGEKASTKLLFPMILMLMVVLGLIMIPAILSFYGGNV